MDCKVIELANSADQTQETLPDSTDSTEPPVWVAVQPPLALRHDSDANQEPLNRVNPPSFRESQFDVILRRQRMRPKEGGGRKFTNVPSRFLYLSNDFEFSGWGSVSHLHLDTNDHTQGDETLQDIRRGKILDQYTASAVAGNDILGGVFYTLPAVVAVASVYSPISLFIATSTLFLWRPIMIELESALPVCGAPYTYLLNVSTKSLALVGAVLLLLDFASTAVVSAATAASYLAGEVTLPFPTFVGSIFVLVIFTFISLAGIRASTRVALLTLLFHVLTMLVLFVASAVQWQRLGNSQIQENWKAGRGSSPRNIIHDIFNGVCVGMLGLTGFESTPAYTSRIKPNHFPLVLRNLHIPAILIDTLTMLMVVALIPLDTILSGVNVLSVLADVASGKWLRIWVVVDAIIVLCGGVLSGIISASELITQLARDRCLPQVFLKVMPFTGSHHIAVISFILFSGVLYASTGASLIVVSKMFSLVWLTVMALFPLSLLLLKISRGRIPRLSRTPLTVILSALVVVVVIFVGNIVIDPSTAHYFIAYAVGIYALFAAAQNHVHLLRWVYWTYDQNPAMHTWRLTKTFGERLIKIMARLRRQPVCILVKTDEINHLFQMVLYVRQNEETSCLKIVHFHDGEDGIPSEMEANSKILDEAFPELTIDLILVPGEFTPANVAALAHRLRIPRSLMFMACPGPQFRHSLGELGTRIISL